MALDAALAARFVAGAGVDPGMLRATAAAVAGCAAILWAAWTIQGLHRRWRSGAIDFLGLAAGWVRAAVLTMLILYFIS